MKINPNIREADTLPGHFYHDDALFEKSKEAVFARSWQLVECGDAVRAPGSAFPFFFMEKTVDEPLVLVHGDDGEMRCLSNVCTHRGNLLVEHPCQIGREITCNYHGRRFGQDGCFRAMPKTEGMANFPSKRDDLAQVSLKKWRQFHFTSLAPAFPFDEIIEGMEEKIGFLPIENFVADPSRSQDYLVKSHWALYCDNYLEGFHIPFIHPKLAAQLDWASYRTELFSRSNVQVGISRGGEHCFDLPAGHPDFGQKISGYYFWVFPNLMFNFYPWGLSLNIVRPLEKGLTKVSFRSFVHDKTKIALGAGGDLHRIELEDEAVVERVQIGIKSRFYDAGRFSPEMETGVHQFHQLLAAAMFA